MTVIRIGASRGNLEDVLVWLENNVGSLNDRVMTTSGINYIGTGWHGKWVKFGSGWFIDVTFDDPKIALLFSLRWK